MMSGLDGVSLQNNPRPGHNTQYLDIEFSGECGCAPTLRIEFNEGRSSIGWMESNPSLSNRVEKEN